LEYARIFNSKFIFLSTSRVYPIAQIEKINTIETDSRFELHAEQMLHGVSSRGISEEFSLNGVRSLYGASKLASELLITEYCQMYELNAIINRCGLLTGPWQFGKVDQGVIVLWVARHYWGKGIKYIGYGGKGKQVRDMLHIDDLYELLKLQIKKINSFKGETFNVGGGNEISCSLLELTNLCQEVTGNIVKIDRDYNNRVADIKTYVTDATKVSKEFNWSPRWDAKSIVSDIHSWIKNNSNQLKDILN
jgi:CDP-paratose 2-epimerase